MIVPLPLPLPLLLLASAATLVFALLYRHMLTVSELTLEQLLLHMSHVQFYALLIPPNKNLLKDSSIPSSSALFLLLKAYESRSAADVVVLSSKHSIVKSISAVSSMSSSGSEFRKELIEGYAEYEMSQAELGQAEEDKKKDKKKERKKLQSMTSFTSQAAMQRGINIGKHRSWNKVLFCMCVCMCMCVL